MQIDQQLNLILEEKMPAFVLEFNEIAEMIDNAQKPFERKFIQQLIDKSEPLYLDAQKDHLHMMSKVHDLKFDKHIKDDVPTWDALNAIEKELKNTYNWIQNGYSEQITKYHTDRGQLERNLHRSQGDKELVEFDQRFVSLLRVNLAQARDIVLVFLKLAEQKMDILLTNSEKQKAKKNEHMSMYT